MKVAFESTQTRFCSHTVKSKSKIDFDAAGCAVGAAGAALRAIFEEYDEPHKQQ
jgi:hypothetical protein